MRSTRSDSGGRHILTRSSGTRASIGGKNVQDRAARRAYVARHVDHRAHRGPGRRARRSLLPRCLRGRGDRAHPYSRRAPMSVQMRLNGALLHLADEFPEMGVLAPPSLNGTAVVLALDVED